MAANLPLNWTKTSDGYNAKSAYSEFDAIRQKNGKFVLMSDGCDEMMGGKPTTLANCKDCAQALDDDRHERAEKEAAKHDSAERDAVQAMDTVQAMERQEQEEYRERYPTRDDYLDSKEGPVFSDEYPSEEVDGMGQPIEYGNRICGCGHYSKHHKGYEGVCTSTQCACMSFSQGAIQRGATSEGGELEESDVATLIHPETEGDRLLREERATKVGVVQGDVVREYSIAIIEEPKMDTPMIDPQLEYMEPMVGDIVRFKIHLAGTFILSDECRVDQKGDSQWFYRLSRVIDGTPIEETIPYSKIHIMRRPARVVDGVSYGPWRSSR